jgi:AraC-like DNA-binding protein
MKPVLEYLPRNSGESFVTKFFDYSYYPTPWHFHPEYELVLVTESTGKRFIGDHISDFAPGDLALIGPYLPHTYRNDQQYFDERSGLRARSIVVHFREDSFGNNFLNIPESQKIGNLLSRSTKGLAVTGQTNTLVSEKLYNLINAKGFSRWLLLLDILNILADSKDISFICNNVITGQNPSETARMNKIIDFVIKNFNREILLSEAADLANMAENSFSRYFSQRTRKSFTGFVNEVRLNHASKLLIATSKSITEICTECGFNNLSNFNRQFRRVYQKNPLTFKKLYNG